MDDQIIETAHDVLRFRTAAEITTRLGSEQLKDEVTAVLELVKNSYDADATYVEVKIEDSADGQALIIEDNGSGMSRGDLINKWALLATQNKLSNDRSPVFGRRRLGQKGVGRFAAEKLGSMLILRTRIKGQAKVLQVRFDWNVLRGERELSEFEFPIHGKNPKQFEPENGTTLRIENLRIKWKLANARKLRAQLCRLIDPDATNTDFKIRYVTPWPELNTPLTNPLPGQETHCVDFEIKKEGSEILKVTVEEQQNRTNTKLAAPSFGPLKGKIRYYGRGLPKTERARGNDPEADWNMGIRLFRDGCRVRPYGEPGPEGDWLQFYRNRYIKGSRFRPKPHYLEGSIYISADTNPNLRDTTSREGLELNDAYHDLVEYLQGKLALLSDLLRDEETKEERKRIKERYKRALDPLSKGLGQLRSEAYRRAVEDDDKSAKRVAETINIQSQIRNSHWECLDCTDSWKAPINARPQKCREFSVGRNGVPTYRPGCGSTNIKRKENIARDDPSDSPLSMDEIMKGVPAYISDKKLVPIIDWDMGERDVEAEVRPDKRELAVNGKHPSFRAADRLDGNETIEGTALEELRAVAALTVHIIDAAAYAWGRWHFEKTNSDFSVFAVRYAELKAACMDSLPAFEKSDSVS